MNAMPTNLEILVAKVKSGDQEAAGVLSVQFQKYVYSCGLKWLGNANDAEELAQNAISHSILTIHQLNSNQCYVPWLRRIAHSMAVKVIKRKQHVLEINDDSVIEYDSEPINYLIQQENSRIVKKSIKKAIRKLKKTDRAMLVEFYFKNKSIETIAKQEKAPIGTIKRRLFVARNRLRVYYKEQT